MLLGDEAAPRQWWRQGSGSGNQRLVTACTRLAIRSEETETRKDNRRDKQEITKMTTMT